MQHNTKRLIWALLSRASIDTSFTATLFTQVNLFQRSYSKPVEQWQTTEHLLATYQCHAARRK